MAYTCPACQRAEPGRTKEQYWKWVDRGTKRYLCDDCTKEMNRDLKSGEHKKYVRKTQLGTPHPPSWQRAWTDGDIKRLGEPDFFGANMSPGGGKHPSRIYMVARIRKAEECFLS